MRSLREHGEHAAVVDATGEVAVDGHLVGRIEGLNLHDRRGRAGRRPAAVADDGGPAAGCRALRRRAGELAAAPDDAVRARRRRQRCGGGVRRGPAAPGRTCWPRLQLADPDTRRGGPGPGRRSGWAVGSTAGSVSVSAPLPLAPGRARDGLTGAGRGIAYRLVEQLGRCSGPRPTLGARPGRADRRALARLGVRFGQHHVFVPDLLKPAASEARTRLADLPRPTAVVAAGRAHGAAVALCRRARPCCRWGSLYSTASPSGSTSWNGIAAQVRALARDSVSFSVPPTMAAEAGLTRAELPRWSRLGLPARGGEAGVVAYTRPAARRRDSPVGTAATGAGPAGSPFAVLAGLQAGAARMSGGLRLDKWLFQARFIHNRRLAESLVAARRVRLNEQIVAKTHQLVRPGDVITLTEQRQVRVLRVRALGERRGPAIEARGLYEEITAAGLSATSTPGRCRR